MDVLDLSWSNNDEYLASCSIDNNVLVWNTKSISIMMTPVRVLTGHSNWVKVCMFLLRDISHTGCCMGPNGPILGQCGGGQASNYPCPRRQTK